jgi:hypothetical protein
VIRLSRAELFELAGAFLIANTPTSLYESLVPTRAVAKLRDVVPREELSVYYDFLTARAKRSAIVLALAYATIIAYVTKSVPAPANDLDLSRLNWGDSVAQTARAKNPPTQKMLVELSNAPTVRSATAPGSSLVLSP